MENVVTKLEDSTFPQTMSTMCGTVGWDIAVIDTLWWVKTAVAGITDALNTMKNTTAPVVMMVQDLKGNRIIYACVKFMPAEDDEEVAAGNWTYYWSWDMESIPENATIYTLDQTAVQEIIRDRGFNLCNMVIPTLEYISQLCVYCFNIIKDILDQQAVEEGTTWALELDGYFEASVEVKDGKKTYSFLPKGEMKVLIKNDSDNEKQ